MSRSRARRLSSAAKDARLRREMPPLPGKLGSVHGEEASRWARAVRSRARSLGVSIGCHARYDLRRVRDGIRPLPLKLYRSIEGYLERVAKDRDAMADLAARPMRIAITPGGPRLHQRGRES